MTRRTFGLGMSGVALAALGGRHHIAGTYDGSTAKGYLDGARDDSVLLGTVNNTEEIAMAQTPPDPKPPKDPEPERRPYEEPN